MMCNTAVIAIVTASNPVWMNSHPSLSDGGFSILNCNQEERKDSFSFPDKIIGREKLWA
jgi:hypothetical protein